MNEITKNRIAFVTEQIKENINTLITDSKTHYFNEVFLKKYLMADIEDMKQSSLKETLFLLYINIDNLAEINAKYGPDAGDETIQHIGYLLSQSIKPDYLLFKRNGPGYIIYIREDSVFSPTQLALKMQSMIKKSSIFVEPISISIASVSLTEVDINSSVNEIVNQLLAKANKRINIVPSFGPNAFLDSDQHDQFTLLGKVLLISSDDVVINMFESFFRNQGYQITSMKDPYEAIDKAYTQSFDAIICERILPKLDGFAIKMKLNDNSFSMNTLFILLSQNKTINIIQRANELRIDYTIARPFIFEEIKGYIEREIKKRGTRL